MKTREAVEKLKTDWILDPCWDIEETEGFEQYRNELVKFHAEMQEKWDKQYEQNIQSARKNAIASRHMTQRTLISAMALEGILSNTNGFLLADAESTRKNLYNKVKFSIMCADELIKQLTETEK
jgi:Na+(H+)/acetate symporter ActP